MRKAIPAALILAVTLTTGCSSFGVRGMSAGARLEPRSGSMAAGSVRFTELSDGQVRVNIDLANVTPGVHGLHLHQLGDCSAPDAASAGPHFDTTGSPHGGPLDSAHHAGDFGNVTADSNGVIRQEVLTRAITVSAGPNSVVGKAIVLHADADDLKSQPAGNSGKRIACGVVETKN